jgi:hypothetical protein
MRNDQIAFRSTLVEMQSWLVQYFHESSIVDAAGQEISAMMAIDLTPELPDISATTRLLVRNESPP